MNVTKLGFRLTSPVLALALCLAPVHGAIAAPADDAAAEGDAATEGDAAAEGDAPAEGDPAAEGDAAEGAEGDAAEGAEGDAAEGDPAAEGDAAEGAEGEPAAEGAEGDAPAEEPVEETPPADEVDEEMADEEMADEGEEDLEAIDDGPLRPPEPAWGPKKQYPMNGKGALIGGGVVAGLGAAGIVTSILITNCEPGSGLNCRFGDQREFLVPLTVTVTGLGLMLVGVGIGNKLRYKKWENWDPEKTAVVPTMMPGGGGGLAWVGRF